MKASLSFLCSLPYRNESDNMHRRVTVNGKPYVEPTGDIGTFSEFVSHTAVQIEIEVDRRRLPECSTIRCSASFSVPITSSRIW